MLDNDFEARKQADLEAGNAVIAALVEAKKTMTTAINDRAADWKDVSDNIGVHTDALSPDVKLALSGHITEFPVEEVAEIVEEVQEEVDQENDVDFASTETEVEADAEVSTEANTEVEVTVVVDINAEAESQVKDVLSGLDTQDFEEIARSDEVEAGSSEPDTRDAETIMEEGPIKTPESVINL
jgi:hypothetical protein